MNLRRHAGPLGIAVAAHVVLALLPIVFEPESAPEPTVVQIRFAQPPEPEPEPEPEPPEPEPEPPEPEPPPPDASPEPPPPKRSRPPKPEPAPQPDPLPAAPQPAADPVPAPAAPRPEPPPPEATPQAKPPAPPPKPVAPRAAARGKADMRGYGTGVYRDMQGHQRYPAAARRLKLEGQGKVKIRIDRRGHLVGKPSIAASTGHAVLDQEALAMVQRAAPFSDLPAEFEKDVATLVIPVRFKLKDAR